MIIDDKLLKMSLKNKRIFMPWNWLIRFKTKKVHKITNISALILNKSKNLILFLTNMFQNLNIKLKILLKRLQKK